MQSVPFLESQIENLRPWVESETGMTFSGDKASRLVSAVTKVLGNTGDRTVAQLDRILAHPKQRPAFLERLTSELTVGESFFFRNKHHFRALQECVLPTIFNENADRKEVRIWSAGCAGGEEPYSVAILINQMLQTRPRWNVHILATDINAQFLEKARLGRYRNWSFRQTNINDNREYFLVDEDEYLLVPHVRQLVRFRCLNLVKDVYPSPLTGTVGLDLILFRNVAIYLKSNVTNAIIRRFQRALRPGGWLLLGETEVTSAPRDGFDVKRIGEATLFQKKLGCESIGNIEPLTFASPLAEILQEQSVQSSVQPSLPNWVPLPKLVTATLSSETASATERLQHYLDQENFAGAEKALDRIPDKTLRATARLKLVRGLLMCAELPRAREMLATCLEEEPLLSEAQLLTAALAEEDGDLAVAEEAYRRALYVDRRCVIGHFHLALLQTQRGNVTEAQRSLKIAGTLARAEDVHDVVPHGEGVCYGRLLEMIEGLKLRLTSTCDE